MKTVIQWLPLAAYACVCFLAPLGIQFAVDQRDHGLAALCAIGWAITSMAFGVNAGGKLARRA